MNYKKFMIKQNHEKIYKNKKNHEQQKNYKQQKIIKI